VSVTDDIIAAIKPAIEATGNFLEEITITPAGKRRMLTVIVDGETHLNLDQVTVITKEISEIVENLATLGDLPFTLEVTSPGIDRPLSLPRHWRKNVGRLVKATLTDGTVIEGRITSADDSAALVEGKKNSESITYSDVKRAVLEIEFKSIHADSQGELDEDGE